MRRSILFPLLFVTFLLVACSSNASPATRVSTPTPTPTPGVTPSPTPSFPTREVHFQTSDNVQLAGVLLGQGQTAVICSHQLRTTKAIWTASSIVPYLASHGYLVLAYDFRGNGDSTGIGDISKMATDLRGAISFVRQQGATKVVLLGASMGGTATLKAAILEPVTALITLSAPQDFGVTVKDTELQALKTPKLFINSENDDFASDTTHMYAVAASPKAIHMYPGRAHGVSIFDDDDPDVTQLISQFLAQYAPM